MKKITAHPFTIQKRDIFWVIIEKTPDSYIQTVHGAHRTQQKTFDHLVKLIHNYKTGVQD